MAISDYSTTAGENTSISGINIAEHCPAANLNDAIRQMMADAKSAYTDTTTHAVHKTGDETISGVKTFTQTIAGTAAAAEKLATARTITLTGDATGSVSFDGSADIELAVTVGNNIGGVVGEIRWFAMSTPPEGWLVCNGAEVLKSDYPALYNAIGNTFLPKDYPEEPGMFLLPDLMGKVPWGSTSVGTVLDAGLPNITGSFGLRPVDGGMNVTWETNNGAIKIATRTGDSSVCVAKGSSKDLHMTASIDASRSSSVYGKSSTVQPPALCLLPCIRYE